MALTKFYSTVKLNSNLNLKGFKNFLGENCLELTARRLDILYRDPKAAKKLDELAQMLGCNTFKDWDAETIYYCLEDVEYCLLENLTRNLVPGRQQIQWPWKVYYRDGNFRGHGDRVYAYTANQAENHVRKGVRTVRFPVADVLEGRTTLDL